MQCSEIDNKYNVQSMYKLYKQVERNEQELSVLACMDNIPNINITVVTFKRQTNIYMYNYIFKKTKSNLISMTMKFNKCGQPSQQHATVYAAAVHSGQAHILSSGIDLRPTQKVWYPLSQLSQTIILSCNITLKLTYVLL